MAQVYGHNNPPTSSGNGSNGAGAVGGVQRSLSRRQKIVRAITNPDQIFQRDPNVSPPPTSKFDSAKLNESKFARALFSPGIDVGVSNQPALSSITENVKEPLDPDEPLWPAYLLEGYLMQCTANFSLPDGYTVRPLTRADYHKGYLDVLRVQEKVGWIGEREWDERCEWLHERGAGTYYTIVICDKSDRVVAIGTLLVERKFLQNMGMVAHLEDVAVSRDQKGKKMGLRILEALVHVAKEVGCYRTTVQCAEQNETFYGQCGFVREGIYMTQKLAREKKDEEVYS